MAESQADLELRWRWSALRACVCLGLLFGMLLSWRLWLSGGRRFPVLPCFGLGELPAPYDWVLFLAALGFCGLAIARRWDRWMVAGLVGSLLVLGTLDQMRWQPWAYQYLLCLLPMLFVSRRDDRAGIAAALDVVRLIIVSIYVWSGIHKFGVQFQRTYESDVVAGLLEKTGGWFRELILWNGHLVPWFEILIGVLLLFPKMRIAGVWMAIGMHAFIMLTLGPFGLSNNSVIWPWNLAMPGVVLALFWKYDGFALRHLFSVKRLRPAAVAIGTLVVFMPVRSYSKKWDQYFSFHLYSGHHQRLALMINNKNPVPLELFFASVIKPAITPPGQQSEYHELSIAAWAMAELNVPMPSEDRMLLRVAKMMVERMDLDAPHYFYRDYPELQEERGFDVYPPAQIRGMSQFPPFRRGGARGQKLR